MRVISRTAIIALGLSVVAGAASGQSGQHLRDSGWPGGDALMVCRDIGAYIPGFGANSDRVIRLEVKDRGISVRSGPHSYDLEYGENSLTPWGFIAKFRRSQIGLTRNTVLTFVANFEKATLTVSAESISWLPTRDRVPVEIDCEVEYGPVFGTAEPETSEADAIWTRIHEIANHVTPDTAPAPPDALLARAPEGVRAASEAARDMTAGGTRASLRDLPYFADNAAGRDYARSPNGRAIAIGYPAERCAATGAAKAALSFSAISDAYGACVAALPATQDAQGCACAAAVVGQVLLAHPSTFDYAARPKLLLATAAGDGARLEVMKGVLPGDPDDPRGLRVDDENGREICAGLATSSAEPFELRCVRFGGRYAARAEQFGRRGMRGFGAAFGVDEARAEAHPRRTLAIFFHFEDAALDRIRAEFPQVWAE